MYKRQVHFVSFETISIVLSKDTALKLGSLSLCVGISIFTFKFAYAHETLCIMDVQSYNLLDPWPILKKQLKKTPKNPIKIIASLAY